MKPTKSAVEAAIAALAKMNPILERVSASAAERSAAKQFIRDHVSGQPRSPSSFAEKIASRMLQASQLSAGAELHGVLAMLASPEMVEVLAAVEHDRWSSWEKYREKCVAEGKREGEDETHEQRWSRLRAMSYDDLEESSKESDRVEARKTIAAIVAKCSTSMQAAPEEDVTAAADDEVSVAEAEQAVVEDAAEQELTQATVVSVTPAGIDLLKSWEGEWGPDQEQTQILRVVASHNLRSLSSLGVAVGMEDAWENIVPSVLRCLNNGLLQVVES